MARGGPSFILRGGLAIFTPAKRRKRRGLPGQITRYIKLPSVYKALLARLERLAKACSAFKEIAPRGVAPREIDPPGVKLKILDPY
jgi:hypothetical protein